MIEVKLIVGKFCRQDTTENVSHVPELGYSLLSFLALARQEFQVRFKFLKARVSLNNFVIFLAILKHESCHLDTWKIYDTTFVSKETWHERFRRIEYSTILSMSDVIIRDLVL